MNTIPTTFNEKITPYTAIGGQKRASSSGLSAVILNRQGRCSRRAFLQELEKTGFDFVLSIESQSWHYDVEELAESFPFARFARPEKEITIGEQINLAASEIESPLFFVMWNDMRIIAGGTARRMAERLSVLHEGADGNGEKKSGFKRLCTVPVIMSPRYEILPTMTMPLTRRGKMRTASMEPQAEEQLSLYPFDGVGIYDRGRFIQMGGFDVTLSNAHWQLMDFGFRSHLWGEKIAFNMQLKLACEGELPAEDTSIGESYRRFYLKNIAPKYRDYYARLPFYNFPPFYFKYGDDLPSAWEAFRECRGWVKRNKSRWERDARGVARLWDNAPSRDVSSGAAAASGER
ncbi:MAG: hypothetical protein LBU82_03110 [Treponema sp.]|jgi:hypothetical protein|nr:hypothetical protein [Treponema sp.]